MKLFIAGFILNNLCPSFFDPEKAKMSWFNFFSKKSKGYSDVLVNPDISYKTDNIRLLQLDLKIIIWQ